MLYIPVAFSDHFAHLVEFRVLDNQKLLRNPKCRSSFKVKPEVINDSEFKVRLTAAIEQWEKVKNNGNMDNGDEMIRWWEFLVKPGIRKIALERTKEINSSKREFLNLLLIRQAYVTKKLRQGQSSILGELLHIHGLIETWYQDEAKKVQFQSKLNEFQLSEKTSLYHHELHKDVIKKTSILQLSTPDGIISGHEVCAKYLESSVSELLNDCSNLDPIAQQSLLKEVNTVFTVEDNNLFLKPPTKEIIKTVLDNSNLVAAPGSDGIPSLLYKEHWDILGDYLTEIMNLIFNCKRLPLSMRTSLIVFGTKPKKVGSILPKDKRRISLLNSDFKLASGLEARLFKLVATHTLSPFQLVAGDDRRIHHGINLARNAIHAASKTGHPGCGILDTDLMAAFDWLCLEWSLKVLRKKGLDEKVIKRLNNLYTDNISVIVVNNIQGKRVNNNRGSLRQGDLPSMHLFCYGIDPLIAYLDKRLKGILISSMPVQGPVQFLFPALSPLEERYKVVGYADDIKPAITCIDDFNLVDLAFKLFEGASGCRLHRDPASKKCKFLPLARWRGTLQQEDIPCGYMSLSDHLEMIGVELYATWSQTRRVNGEYLQKRISDTIRVWKAGKFMPLTQRSWSLNLFCFSKIWFKTHSINLRGLDYDKMTSAAKSWLYRDMFFKPEEIIMYRRVIDGGLGLINIRLKALAGLIRSFLETACIPKYRQSIYHHQLFLYHVLEDRSIKDPGMPPFYDADFFHIIRSVHLNPTLNVVKMSERQWYQYMLEEKVIMEQNAGSLLMKQCRVERQIPLNNWESTWKRCRMAGLGPNLSSFLFKVVHELLPTQVRLCKADPSLTGKCKLCTVNTMEDLEHALIGCNFNDGAGSRIIECVSHNQVQTCQSILKLNFVAQPRNELPVLWMLSIAWNEIWEKRKINQRPELFKIRAKLEAQISILRETRRFKDGAANLESLMQFL